MPRQAKIDAPRALYYIIWTTPRSSLAINLRVTKISDIREVGGNEDHDNRSERTVGERLHPRT